MTAHATRPVDGNHATRKVDGDHATRLVDGDHATRKVVPQSNLGEEGHEAAEP